MLVPKIYQNRVLEASWAVLGDLGDILGRLGGVLGSSWAILGRLGGVLGRLGSILEASWAVLKASWSRLADEKRDLCSGLADTRGVV